MPYTDVLPKITIFEKKSLAIYLGNHKDSYTTINANEKSHVLSNGDIFNVSESALKFL